MKIPEPTCKNSDEFKQSFARCMARRDFETALSLCEIFINEYPKSHVGHRKKAHVLNMMGESEHALQEISTTIELKPQEPAFYVARALMRIDLMMFEETLVDLAEAERWSAFHGSTYYLSLILFFRAVCLNQLSRYRESLEILTQLPEDMRWWILGKLTIREDLIAEAKRKLRWTR